VGLWLREVKEGERVETEDGNRRNRMEWCCLLEDPNDGLIVGLVCNPACI
jgi:hypothetical protein